MKDTKTPLCYKGGQRVRFTKYVSDNCTVGATGTTVALKSGLGVVLDYGYESNWIKNPQEYLEVIEDNKYTNKYPNPPHKHAELIKVWADGAEIEFKEQGWGWVGTSNPMWDEDTAYRIKPQPSQQEVEKQSIIDEIAKLQERLDKLEVK